jgi:hypothetical protein
MWSLPARPLRGGDDLHRCRFMTGNHVLDARHLGNVPILAQLAVLVVTWRVNRESNRPRIEVGEGLLRGSNASTASL